VLGVGDEERPDAFQDTMSRFGRHTPEAADAADAADGTDPASRRDLAVWFFDCLHRDGIDLIDEPLIRRQAVLADVAGRWRVPSILTDDAGEAAGFLDTALAAGHEGVMVKEAMSTYEAGRRGKAWRKVKPVITLDLVVLAAEWGYGRREGWLSNIHLGARDPDGGFVMVGKTFKGMTDAMLTWQTERFLSLEESRHRQVVELRPELVVEVALDGVQVSSRYKGGVALRFARVRRYREDKTASEADTIDEVRKLLPGARAG
jgi:DNA ligase-1